MPGIKSVKSLETLCYHNIAQHMDTYWCRNYVQTYSSQGKYTNVIGPFEYLSILYFDILLLYLFSVLLYYGINGTSIRVQNWVQKMLFDYWNTTVKSLWLLKYTWKYCGHEVFFNMMVFCCCTLICIWIYWYISIIISSD